ncbi:BAHD acyltransferase DCR [Fusarium pseudoanthophilum]|uniref:BAHD acyltransferase DCR n=1 Tax=Fusarium pseudoanthophilum TaxID=48495 RepID=A0A8H5KI93_9HYPO|nr:BAHD acyltransferase DCR [Fusarium pseudoanthophilum]
MLSTLNFQSETPAVLGDQDRSLVTLEHYDLQPVSAKQRLTPLDMNMPRLYGIRLILCFATKPGVEKQQIYENLKKGLAHTVTSIPWISGVIGPEEGQDPKARKVQILDSPGGFRFPYKDLTDTLPSYAELRERNFPLAEFTTAQVGPIDVMPQGPDQPVFAAQVNFVEGGILLTVGVHHSACDASALDAILSTWSHNTAVASGGSGSFSTFDVPSNDRSPLMEGDLGNVDVAAFPEYVLMPTPHSTEGDLSSMSGFQLPPLASHLFHFSSESLTKLKEDAGAFSSHDALCAFTWQRMTLARMQCGVFSDPPGRDSTSRFCFAVNIRSRMSPPLPPSYMGNASMGCVTEKISVATIISDNGLKHASAAMRRSLNDFNSPRRVATTIGLLKSQPDPTDFKLSFNGFLGPDVVESSWADLGVYGHQWGNAVGTLDAVRIPGEGSDGTMMILPRLKDGGLDVVVGLSKAAMDKLLKDEEFASFADS